MTIIDNAATEDAVQSGRFLARIFEDWEKYFDRCTIELQLMILRYAGVSPELIRWYAANSEHRVATLLTDQGRARVHQLCGYIQGLGTSCDAVNLLGTFVARECWTGRGEQRTEEDMQHCAAIIARISEDPTAIATEVAETLEAILGAIETTTAAGEAEAGGDGAERGSEEEREVNACEGGSNFQIKVQAQSR